MQQTKRLALTERMCLIAPRRLLVLICIGMVLAGVSWAVLEGQVQRAATVAALSLICLGGVLFLLRAGHTLAQRQSSQSLRRFITNDSAASFITTDDGQIISSNQAAARVFGDTDMRTLSSVLADRMGNPGPTLYRLQSRAQTSGSAREEIVANSGQILLSVHSIGLDRFAWRVEPQNVQTAGSMPSDARILPMMMVGRSGAILSMNHAARQFIGARGKSLDSVFAEQVIVPGTVMQVSTTLGNQPALIAQTDAGAGRRAIYLLPPPATDGAPQNQDWQVFQDMPIPMIKIAPDGTVQSFNKRASKLIGVVLVEGSHLSALMEGLGRSISDWLEDTLESRLVQKSEFLRLTRGDREAFVQVTLNRIEEEGRPALVAVLHDATELKSLEAQFVQSQKMQAIGQLAGGWHMILTIC